MIQAGASGTGKNTHPGVACLTNNRFNQPAWNTLRFLRLSIQINCIYLLMLLIAE